MQANVWTGQSSSTPLKVYDGTTTEEMMLALWGILSIVFFIQTLVLTPSSTHCLHDCCGGGLTMLPCISSCPCLEERPSRYLRCVQRINRALQITFLSVSILFFLRAGGVRNELCYKVRCLKPLPIVKEPFLPRQPAPQQAPAHPCLNIIKPALFC